jgi:hypothetical protein
LGGFGAVFFLSSTHAVNSGGCGIFGCGAASPCAGPWAEMAAMRIQ